jgi:hypothetical protein
MIPFNRFRHTGVIIAALLLPVAVMAANTTTTIDPGMSTDWTIWILAGLIGLILFAFSLSAPQSKSDVEIDTIISVMAWIPIGFCAYASFNVSRITGTGYQTLYSYGTIGILMYIFLAVAILNTVRLIALHRVFSGNGSEQND